MVGLFFCPAKIETSYLRARACVCRHATWLRELDKQHATTLSLAAKIISVLDHARKLISVIYRLLK